MSKIRVKKEFKKVVVEESSLKNFFSRSGGSSMKQIEDTLDRYGKDSWVLESIESDCFRTLFFFPCDVITITLSRPIALSGQGTELSPSSVGQLEKTENG